jgi:hypothetical protein
MLPKKGKKLHRRRDDGGDGVDHSIAAALRHELGATNRAVKTVMIWTGASERTVKNWFAGSHEPSGRHLIDLIRHSDAVLDYLLSSADRPGTVVGVKLLSLRAKLRELTDMLDALSENS